LQRQKFKIKYFFQKIKPAIAKNGSRLRVARGGNSSRPTGCFRYPHSDSNETNLQYPVVQSFQISRDRGYDVYSVFHI